MQLPLLPTSALQRDLIATHFGALASLDQGRAVKELRCWSKGRPARGL